MGPLAGRFTSGENLVICSNFSAVTSSERLRLYFGVEASITLRQDRGLAGLRAPLYPPAFKQGSGRQGMKSAMVVILHEHEYDE